MWGIFKKKPKFKCLECKDTGEIWKCNNDWGCIPLGPIYLTSQKPLD